MSKKDALSDVFFGCGGWTRMSPARGNQRPPGYERQSQTAHRGPPGCPIFDSLTIFGSKEPGGLRLVNRRPDFCLEASPGDNITGKIMIQLQGVKNIAVFGSEVTTSAIISGYWNLGFLPEDRIPAYRP
jgi:hypothetical protein